MNMEKNEIFEQVKFVVMAGIVQQGKRQTLEYEIANSTLSVSVEYDVQIDVKLRGIAARITEKYDAYIMVNDSTREENDTLLYSGREVWERERIFKVVPKQKLQKNLDL